VARPRHRRVSCESVNPILAVLLLDTVKPVAHALAKQSLCFELLPPLGLYGGGGGGGGGRRVVNVREGERRGGR